MSKIKEESIVLIDSAIGIYIPQNFAKMYDEDRRWVGADDAELTILTKGPDHPLYWEAWEYVLDRARYYDKDGREWKLWQEGDLFAYTGEGEQWT